MLDCFSDGTATVGNSFTSRTALRVRKSPRSSSARTGSNSADAFASVAERYRPTTSAVITLSPAGWARSSTHNNPTGAISTSPRWSAIAGPCCSRRWRPPRFAPSAAAPASSRYRQAPTAALDQTDIGVFVADAWRFRPNLTLGLGLRYENQTNISSNHNFAPRVSLAWGLDGRKNKATKTVLRLAPESSMTAFPQNLTLQPPLQRRDAGHLPDSGS